MIKSVLKSIGIAASYIALQIIVGLIFVTTVTLKKPQIMKSILGTKDFSIITSYATTWIMGIFLISIFIFVCKRKKINPLDTSLELKIFRGNCLRGLGWCVVVWIITTATVNILFPQSNNKIQINSLMILTTCILSPIMEEIVFRYGIISTFKEISDPRSCTTAIILSGVLFGMAHGNLIQGIPAMITGMLFAHYYIKTESLSAPICLHMFFNFLSAYIQYFFSLN